MDAYLIDDGTLDTVVGIGNKVYRYNFDDGDENQSYDDFVEWALVDAIEQYQEELEEVK